MACRRPWDRQQLVDVLPKHFVHGGLKAWREEVLYERERGMLPATVPLLAAKRAVAQHWTELSHLRGQQRQLLAIVASCQLLLRRIEGGDLGCEAESDPDYVQLLQELDRVGLESCTLADLPKLVKEAQRRRHANLARTDVLREYIFYARERLAVGQAPMPLEAFLADYNNGDSDGEAAGRVGRRARHQAAVWAPTYVRPCPGPGCRGFLDAATFACAVCDHRACSKCHEMLPAGADAADDHACDAANVASAELILKDTKPCPKCAVRIFRIEGCAQMFCTSCHTAFDWRTGEIETRHIHNPHYYAWVREHNNGEVPREPGDEAPGGGGCDDGVRYLAVEAWLRASLGFRSHTQRAHGDGPTDAAAQSLGETVAGVHRLMVHCQMDELHRYTARPLDNFDLRIDFLDGSLGDLQFKRELHKRDKRVQKRLAIRQVFEMFVTVLGDVFRNRMADRSHASVAALVEEALALVAYANDCFAAVSQQFNNAAPSLRSEDHYFYVQRFGTHAE
jgi:hypothetical protein